jgi:pimeloyl-ACP methyl ester carboxylesterase
MTTQFLQTSAGKLAYEESGSGPLIICVPSMGDLRQEYRFLVPSLVAANYRAVSLDVRGHGESGTTWSDYSVAGIGRDILDLVKHLEAGPAVVIGTSMAAGAAIWAAVEEPAALRGMVMIGPIVHGDPGFFLDMLVNVMFARPWGPAAWQRYYTGLYPTHKPDDFSAYTSGLRANLSEPGRQEALQAMLHASKKASEARVADVKTPALVLMGSKDPDFKDPAAEAAWLAQTLHAECHVLANAGHYPQAEFPAETAALILPFLKSLG